jgi:hypothetical protein
VSPFRRAGARWVLAVFLGAGCGSPPPASAPIASERHAPPLHDGPLSDYVPSAGLRWMVLGRPKEIASDPALAKALGLLMPDARLDLFARSSGVDLRQTSGGLIAGFDQATLFIAETPRGSDEVERRFSERLVAGALVKKPHPQIDRVAGVVGQTPETLVRVDDKLVAVSVGSGLPARVVELYALGKLKKSPPAFKGASLQALPIAELERAPARFYAPGPFDDDWAHGARGLLVSATAIGAAFRPAGEGHLAVTLVIAGDFGNAAVDPAALLTQAWNDLAASNLGRLLGLDAPVSPPSVSATPNLLRLSVELDTGPLATGLYSLVKAEVWEILKIEAPKH